MSSSTGRAFDLPILKRVMHYVLPYQSTFWLTALLTVILAFLSPIRPWLIQYTLDDYIINSDKEGLILMTILMIATLVLESVFQFYQTYFANWLGQSVIKDIRAKLFKHIVSFRLRYFDKTAIGTLITRVISDIETIADIFSQGILDICGDILKLLVVVLAMFYTDWRLTLISLASIPILLIATNIFKNAVKAAFQDVRTQVARLNAFVQEHITGMNIVQIFNRENEEMEKFVEINKKHRDAHIRSVWAYSVFFPVVEILSSFSLALLIWLGAKEVISGTVTFGNLVAFILYIHMLFRPIRQLADRFNVLQMGVVSSERVFKILDTEWVIENSGTIKDIEPEGNIRFENVWFAYNETISTEQRATGNHSGNQLITSSTEPEWVLKNLSFNVTAGEKLALVGATGAGKSSIINILGRFYEFQKGNIFIDNININDFDLESLRKNVGVVLQDVFLFSDTIYNNITLHNPSISKETVIDAAKAIGAHDFISALPGNYDYNVMERGAMLSVGQRQLIAFIRAFVYNPGILVLDEATSSVDTESENLIQHATEKITENRTSIIIAHRLSTIQKADKIIVMDHGEIIEQGNHQELLKNNGQYKRLFELQFTK